MSITELNNFLELLSEDEQNKYNEFIHECDKGYQIDLANLVGKTITLVGVASDRVNALAMRVFKIEDSYFRIDGHYDSWNGADFSFGSLRPVNVVERTVTFYE
jgi:hypothetical protein